MNIAIALVAAVLTGSGLVLQQQVAEMAPNNLFLHFGLIVGLLHQRRWVLGIVIMVAGQILSAWSIGTLDLSVAEPLLATNLIWALLLAVPLTGSKLHRSELIGALVLAGGVGALSASRTATTEGLRFGSVAYWPAAAAIGFIALVLVRAGWRRSGPVRGTLTGLASGMIFGVTDALTRQTIEMVQGHALVTVLTSWPAYCLVASGAVAVWLMESSFNAAPLHASLPGITAAEPVVGILLGVVIFGDVIHVSPALIAVQAGGIVLLVVGVILVARAPALSNLRATIADPLLAARAREAESRAKKRAKQP